ncbi:MAG: hypothetical protein ACRDQX_15720 [Pseudonocardiaceae bacterium]
MPLRWSRDVLVLDKMRPDAVSPLWDSVDPVDKKGIFSVLSMVPSDGEEPGMPDVAFIVLTIVVFAVLALAVRGVERLVSTDGATVENEAQR